MRILLSQCQIPIILEIILVRFIHSKELERSKKLPLWWHGLPQLSQALLQVRFTPLMADVWLNLVYQTL
ncbi:uncharacterized protein METZ01_LOCUS346294, partial [marine metagenome]